MIVRCDRIWGIELINIYCIFLYSYQRYQFNTFDTLVETYQKYVIVIVVCLTWCMYLIIAVVLLLNFVNLGNLVSLLLCLCYAAVLGERVLKIGEQSMLFMISRYWYLWNVVSTGWCWDIALMQYHIIFFLFYYGTSCIMSLWTNSTLAVLNCSWNRVKKLVYIAVFLFVLL